MQEDETARTVGHSGSGADLGLEDSRSSKRNHADHPAKFMPANDSRNRRIPGLYVRNGRYYALLSLRGALIAKESFEFQDLLRCSN